MVGDRIIISDKHRKAAQQIFEAVEDAVESSGEIYTISVSGESGSGKSETAHALAEKLDQNGTKCLLFQQDDYFNNPPRSNERMRRQRVDRNDLSCIGMHEVKLELLDSHLSQAKSGATSIHKPLVLFDEDRISEETVLLDGIRAIIVEGTYTTSLSNIDARVFIDLTFRETKLARLERARELQDDFLERVLEVEHSIISAYKKQADFIIQPGFDVVINNSRLQ